MSVKLSPAVLRMTYTYLSGLYPFTRWALPPADAMQFHVYRHRGHLGDYRDGNIWISSYTVGYLSTLQIAMAHEMLHAAQHVDGTETKGVTHNADFRARARLVCNRFGFDYKVFH